MHFRIAYEFVAKGMYFEDLVIEADDAMEAGVLAKYRVERGTDNAFRVLEIVMEQDVSRFRVIAGGLYDLNPKQSEAYYLSPSKRAGNAP